MSRDYSALLLEYPEIISKEQVYQICHISKRKATWLLENGIIPCKDTGKKTHRFQIRTIDVVNYLRKLEGKPPTSIIPINRPDQDKQGKAYPITQIPEQKIRKKLYTSWAEFPDALTTKQISQLTGYSTSTIRQWILKKKLRSICCSDGRRVAKQWLIEFIAAYICTCPSSLSRELEVIANELTK